ncbi:ABC transporter substrate-binding protein [Desulfovibrio psychrotolerans]|uniref:Sugar ABC transporter substrate-binding protein n=1 Tax=Desulfovibrio psychrotolerans TaxID=415242 RepID=A0A7J0BTE4_9BACT|nr:hypothetical protein [Desulfovibrio psychrotolerans]GFM36987.1 hypothetical protein DSM19430T_16710 [Desulfovibrio psychrotolerans]
MLIFFPATQAWAEKVLVVQSYSSCFGWDAGYLRGLFSVLGPEKELRTFEMDTKRIPPELFAEKAAEALRMVEEYAPDLVVLGDDNANRLLAPTLVPRGIPLVYLGLNANPREYGLYGHAHVAGIMERPLLLQSLHVAKSILPTSVRRVLFLFDGSVTSSLIAEDVFRRGHSMELAGIRADMVLASTEEDWMHAVRGAAENGYDVVFIGLYQRLKDAGGNSADGDAVLAKTMRELRVPAMGLWDFSIGAGKAAAGLVHVGEHQGRAAGELALRFLAGERSVQIPVTAESGVFMFSRSEALRQGFVIPEAMVADAIVVE